MFDKFSNEYKDEYGVKLSTLFLFFLAGGTLGAVMVIFSELNKLL